MKKHLNLFTVLLIFLFLFSRLYNLTLLPIFTDESIYIYWAKFISVNQSHWFLSLTDGKPPLLIWMISVLLTILPHNLYLLAGRLPSVFAGLGSIIAIYLVTLELFKQKSLAQIAALLYIISPFLLFHDRMALFDSLLNCMLLWSVYFALKTAESLKHKDALLWGLALGLAYLSKPTAVIFVFLTPVVFLLSTEIGIIKKEYRQLILLIIIAIAVGETINNLQRVSSVYYLMDAKNQQFRLPLTQLLNNLLPNMIGNLRGFYSWILSYYTWPFLISGLLALIYTFVRSFKKGLCLLVLWLVPIVGLAAIGREIFPRYIIFTTPYFLIPIAFTLYRLYQNKMFKILSIIIFTGILSKQLIFDYYLLTSPPTAPFPRTDYNQYVSEHPSGYGLDKVFAFLDGELAKGKVTVATQGTFGLYHYAFLLEYWDNESLTIIPRWPLSVVDGDIISAQETSTVYVILKEYENIPPDLPLELVLKAEKPGGKYPILVTKLKN